MTIHSGLHPRNRPSKTDYDRASKDLKNLLSEATALYDMTKVFGLGILVLFPKDAREK